VTFERRYAWGRGDQPRESARLIGVDAHAGLTVASNAALAAPGIVTLPDTVFPKA
jgi:hypothetical protein